MRDEFQGHTLVVVEVTAQLRDETSCNRDCHLGAHSKIFIFKLAQSASKAMNTTR